MLLVSATVAPLALGPATERSAVYINAQSAPTWRVTARPQGAFASLTPLPASCDWGNWWFRAQQPSGRAPDAMSSAFCERRVLEWPDTVDRLPTCAFSHSLAALQNVCDEEWGSIASIELVVCIKMSGSGGRQSARKRQSVHSLQVTDRRRRTR